MSHHKLSCHKHKQFNASCFTNRPEVTAPHPYPVFFLVGELIMGIHRPATVASDGYPSDTAKCLIPRHMTHIPKLFDLLLETKVYKERVLCLLPSAPCKSSITAASSIAFPKPIRFITPEGKRSFLLKVQ